VTPSPPLAELLLLFITFPIFFSKWILALCSCNFFLYFSDRLRYAAVGLAAGTAAVVAAPAVLSAVGFTAGGVAAGSTAASIQSVFYGGSVASGSAFALAQSAGAAGIGLGGNAAIGGITGGIAALGTNLYVCIISFHCLRACFIRFSFSLNIIVFSACKAVLK